MNFKICLSLFGWKGNILPKEHIVHCGFVKGKLSETFLSEKLPIVQGARLDICRERCRSRETTFTCTITKCVRKILESTDHTLVPMHYKQLAGQVWHSPNFKRKKCWEQTCKERNNEHEHTSTKYIFFIDWGKKDHFLHLWKRVWNRMQAQHCKWSGRYLYWIEVDQAQSTLGLFFWNSADTAQGTTHCQRHHEPRCWLL